MSRWKRRPTVNIREAEYRSRWGKQTFREFAGLNRWSHGIDNEQDDRDYEVADRRA
jgi:hypothetical protein